MATIHSIMLFYTLGLCIFCPGMTSLYSPCSQQEEDFSIQAIPGIAMGRLLRWRRGMMRSSFLLKISKHELAKHLADVSDIFGALPRFPLAGFVLIF